MNHKAALILLILAVLAALTGCIDDTVSAEEIKQNNLEAIENLDTYEFDADISINIESSGGDYMSQIGDFKVNTSMEGKVDEPNQRMYAMASQETMGFQFDYESFLIGSEIYLRYINGMNMGMGMELTDTWIKMDLGEEFQDAMKSQEYMDNQRQILSISEVTYKEETELDGEPVYVINLEPDPDEFIEIVNELDASSMSGDLSPDEESDNSGVIGDTDSIEFRNISITYWISTETSQLQRSDMNLVMSTSGGVLGESNTTLDMSINFSNHNEDIEINLPEEANDAVTLEEYLGQMMDNQSMDQGFGSFEDSG